ncbi:MAG: DUF1501 domain-containing protein [Planctomycetota bacterium]
MIRNQRRSRRGFLRCAAAGAAAVAYERRSLLTLAADSGNGHVLAPKATHFPPKAKRLLFVFLTGGFSHVDTFDPKPKLREMHGKPFPAFGLRPEEARAMPLLGSPFEFKQCGDSGLSISELFPHLQSVADELCVIRTLHTDIVEHFQATLAMHTGSATIPLPSIGAWLSHGLGTFNPNLPSYVVFAEHLPYAGSQVWDSNFLPPHHQGVRIVPGDEPIPNLRSTARSTTLAELEAAMLHDVNDEHAARRPGDENLTARAASFTSARGMMAEAPEVFAVSQEPSYIRERYGLKDGDTTSFAWQCLVSRRLLERGVRVVELIDNGSHDNWDAHGNMKDHVPKARRVDQPLAALIQDLKQRGLLDDTLVAICTEFGRTPWSDGGNGKGRNHYAKAFTCLLAGAGARGGFTYGETDEFGSKIIKDPCHVHDYHATILHLLGIDHTRLTYHYAGRNYRLTDVYGSVLPVFHA